MLFFLSLFYKKAPQKIFSSTVGCDAPARRGWWHLCSTLFYSLPSALSAPFCKKRHQKLLARRLVVTLPPVVVGSGLRVGLDSRVPCSMQGIEAVVCGVPLKRAWRLATSSTLCTLRFAECATRLSQFPTRTFRVVNSPYISLATPLIYPPNSRNYPNLSSPKLGEVPFRAVGCVKTYPRPLFATTY